MKHKKDGTFAKKNACRKTIDRALDPFVRERAKVRDKADKACAKAEEAELKNWHRDE